MQNSLLNLYVLVLPVPVFYSVQVPLRRKVHICCMFTIGGAAVALGFVRMHSLKALDSGTETSRAVGEMMIVGALGMSLAAIAHNIPSLRIYWKHVSASRARRCRFDSTPRGGLPSTALLGTDGTVYGVASTQSAGLVSRPLPALPVAARHRYPAVGESFGVRPRTPPSVAWAV